MNSEVCRLKELEVEHFEVREVLKCILHTIMFHRALGLVRPKDVHLELFDITYDSEGPVVFPRGEGNIGCLPDYVQCGDLEFDKKIDKKIEHFISWIEKRPNKKSQICLSFYEVKNKKASWLSNKVERLYWEHWYISLNVAQNPKVHSSKSYHSKFVVDLGETALDGRSARKTALEAALQDVLFQIIKFVNEKKDHIPPIPTCEGISFPYEITIPSSSDSAFGMDMIKRMLQTGHPSMLS